MLRFRLDVEGTAEPRGPLLILSNHARRTDPWMLALLPWSVFRSITPVMVPTRSDQFYLWWRPFISVSGAYPLSVWVSSLEEAWVPTFELLDSGASVLVFPEGRLVPNGRGSIRAGVRVLLDRAPQDRLYLHVTYEKRVIRVRYVSGPARKDEDVLDRIYGM